MLVCLSNSHRFLHHHYSRQAKICISFCGRPQVAPTTWWNFAWWNTSHTYKKTKGLDNKCVSHRNFLRHYKRLTIFSLVFLYALQNTRLSFESIVCYTFENFPTKTINSINWNLFISFSSVPAVPRTLPRIVCLRNLYLQHLPQGAFLLLRRKVTGTLH